MIFYIVNPLLPPALSSWDYAAEIMFKYKGNPPLGLLTMAGMIPRHHTVKFCDENTHLIDFDTPCDYVCLSGMHLQKPRIKEIAAEFHRRGKKIILGGPSLMAIPDEYANDADIRIVGEAERIWPECLKDIENGVEKSLYTETETVDITTSPIPRYDLVSVKKYLSVSLQTTRGCPYVCEFCDIITLYGRRPRTKTIEQVTNEIISINKLGAEQIFFSDDNFIGDPKYTKKLLLAVIDLQKKLGKKFHFYCQATINLAKNTGLLQLMQEAGFKSVFIGVETPRVESLQETGKVQNLRNDMIEDIRTIRSYGIMIMSGVVVGFDNDDPSIYHEQLQFLQDANIPSPLTTMLGALPGTPLHKRVIEEGRLLDDSFVGDSYSTNIIPLGMTRQELYEGFAWLNEEMYTPENYCKRIIGEITELEANPCFQKQYPTTTMLFALTWILLWYVLDPHRRALLTVFSISVPLVLRKHRQSLGYLVEYLLRYRHICYIVRDIRQSCNNQFGTAKTRWVPSKIRRYTMPSRLEKVSTNNLATNIY